MYSVYDILAEIDTGENNVLQIKQTKWMNHINWSSLHQPVQPFQPFHVFERCSLKSFKPGMTRVHVESLLQVSSTFEQISKLYIYINEILFNIIC